jgi:predicted SprT family Zn-dependent metalloprotease
MTSKKRQLKALAALNYDLFAHQPPQPPAPATLYGKIREQRLRTVLPTPVYGIEEIDRDDLPTVAELYRRIERFNWLYFNGRLPSVRVEYSNRMTSAGSYTPADRVIRIGRKYHVLFPQDIDDTLKHEMIHILHFRHNADFRREARRIGASVRAKSHPSLRRPPRYVYTCPGCEREYPRQKRLRMASCGHCSAGGRYDKRFKLKLLSSPASRRSEG